MIDCVSETSGLGITCFVFPGLPGGARGTSQKTDDTQRRSRVATGMSDVLQ